MQKEKEFKKWSNYLASCYGHKFSIFYMLFRLSGIFVEYILIGELLLFVEILNYLYSELNRYDRIKGKFEDNMTKFLKPNICCVFVTADNLKLK